MRNSMKLLHKKRGNRTSVPRVAGSLAETLIDAVLTLAGAMVLVWLTAGYITQTLAGRTPTSLWPLLLIGLAALACMGTGLVRLLLLILRFATTAERRSALVGKATAIERKRRSIPPHEFPCLPADSDLSNSPGTRLRHRLHCSGRGVRSFVFWGLLALVLAPLASGLLSVGLSHAGGSVTQILLILLAGLCLIGAGLAIWRFLKTLVPWFRCGPTLLEVSNHPLVPGESVELFMVQIGRMRLREIQIALECVEIALFQQGTDVRRESRVVASWPLFKLDRVEITTQKPFEQQLKFVVPPQAMHSFVASSNAIQWRLSLTARGVGVPDLNREAIVTLYPPTTAPRTS